MQQEVKANGMDGYIVPIYDPRWRLVWGEKGTNEVKGSIPFEQTDEFCKEMNISKLKPRARYPVVQQHSEIVERIVGPSIRIALEEYNYWIDCTTGDPKFVFRVYDDEFPEGYIDFDIQKHDLRVIIDDEAAAVYIGTGKEQSYVGYTAEEIAKQAKIKQAAKIQAAALAKKQPMLRR